jgi:hypothetical protein
MTAQLTEGLDRESAAVYQALIDLLLSKGISDFMFMIYRVLGARALAEIKIQDAEAAGKT